MSPSRVDASRPGMGDSTSQLGQHSSFTARRTMNAPVPSRVTGIASISRILQLYPLAILATSAGWAETASLQFGQASTGPARTEAQNRRSDEGLEPRIRITHHSA